MNLPLILIYNIKCSPLNIWHIWEARIWGDIFPYSSWIQTTPFTSGVLDQINWPTFRVQSWIISKFSGSVNRKRFQFLFKRYIEYIEYICIYQSHIDDFSHPSNPCRYNVDMWLFLSRMWIAKSFTVIQWNDFHVTFNQAFVAHLQGRALPLEFSVGFMMVHMLDFQLARNPLKFMILYWLS